MLSWISKQPLVLFFHSKNLSVLKAKILEDGHENSDLMEGQLPTLTDRFKRHHSYLCISITERCNLRCSSLWLILHSWRRCSTITHWQASFYAWNH
jgi:hypothetical protein